MEAKNLAELYDLPTLDWSLVTDRLDRDYPQAPGTQGPSRHTCWLTTIDADGRPHTTGIGGMWLEHTFWFQTGEHTRKGRNLARDPRVTLALATEEFDLVLEGSAEMITDPAAVAAMAEVAVAGGWPARVDESGTKLTAEYSAPSAGRPPWSVYRITPERAMALATIEPGGATSWTFG
jgi:PPOX class probable F420-dependent enzyme